MTIQTDTQISNDGIVKTSDGRWHAAVRVGGVDTTNLEHDDWVELVNNYQLRLDRHLSDYNWVSYSVTWDFDVDAMVEQYQDASNRDAKPGRDWAVVRELATDLSDWYYEEMDNRKAKRWARYVFVSVHPSEINTTRPHEESDWKDNFPYIGQKTDPEKDDREERRMVTELRKRLRKAKRACNAVGRTDSQSDVTVVSSAEHTLLQLKHWSDRTPGMSDPLATTTPGPRAANTDASHYRSDMVATAPDPDEEMAEEMANSKYDALPDGILPSRGNSTDRPESDIETAGVPPEYDSLTTSEIEKEGGYLKVGSEYVKTFWVSTYPIAPPPGYLKELYTMRGIDLEVTTRARSRNKSAELDRLKSKIAALGVEVDEAMEDDGKIAAADISEYKQAYVDYYNDLRSTNQNPWGVTTYISIRVSPDDAIDEMRDEEDGTIPNDLAEEDIPAGYQYLALKNKIDKVEEVLENEPAECILEPENGRQKELFQSVSPTESDVFNLHAEQSKTQPMPTWSLAAMFPYTGVYPNEPGGIEFGMNCENAAPVILNRFGRKTAPHMIVAGDSGSGKSYGVNHDLFKELVTDDDTIVITTDTMQGFDAATEAYNGERIVVGGQQSPNPFHIEQIPRHIWEQYEDELDPFNMAVQQATSFLCSFLQPKVDNIDDYRDEIKQSVKDTFYDAGITSDYETHSRESPTLADFLRVNAQKADDPSQFTNIENENTLEKIQDKASDLERLLRDFEEDRGIYSHFRDESNINIQDADFLNLDLQQIDGKSDAESAALLMLYLSGVYQLIKRSRKRAIFVLDELHYLFETEITAKWLARASRHLRHYNGGLVCSTQTGEEFLDNKYARTVKKMASIYKLNRMDDMSYEVGEEFNLNEQEVDFLNEEAATGEDYNYSESIMWVEGWGTMQLQVVTSPFLHLLIEYEASKHGDFERYIFANWGELQAADPEVEPDPVWDFLEKFKQSDYEDPEKFAHETGYLDRPGYGVPDPVRDPFKKGEVPIETFLEAEEIDDLPEDVSKEVVAEH